jgi:NADPH:quinone reductase-like Zn-dependent oxidoreductase
LVKCGNVKKGDTVLIHAGSGGVGYMAIQIAKHFGATVTATSSGKNRDFVLSLGADRHIDYTTEKFYETVTEMDLVIDPVGGEIREQFSAVYPFSQMAEAHLQIESKRTLGKIVVEL